MVTHISHSPEETADLGQGCAAQAAACNVFALCGDLGSGKTQWVKGFARGLGISECVHSPTFALINEYSGGRLTLYHLDLYRLDRPDLVVSAGLGEYLQPETGVSIVEWADHWFTPLNCPPTLTWVRFETLSDTKRRITYEGAGY